MSNGAKTIGWIVGTIALLVMLAVIVPFSYGKWNGNIARAKIHHGWIERQGVVVDDNQPDFADEPPDRLSTIQYTDYYGRTERVNVDLPYRSSVGDKTEVDVGSAGTIYAPAATNNANQVYRDPLKAHPFFWPWGGIAVLGAIGAIIALLIGLVVANMADSVPSPRGRLGSL